MGNLSPEAAIAAKSPVAVVPMLDPRVIGYTLSIRIIPIPTKGVKAEVKTELLWTSMVIPAPTQIAIYPVKKGSRGKSAFNVFLMTYK